MNFLLAPEVDGSGEICIGQGEDKETAVTKRVSSNRGFDGEKQLSSNRIIRSMQRGKQAMQGTLLTLLERLVKEIERFLVNKIKAHKAFKKIDIAVNF